MREREREREKEREREREREREGWVVEREKERKKEKERERKINYELKITSFILNYFFEIRSINLYKSIHFVL